MRGVRLEATGLSKSTIPNGLLGHLLIGVGDLLDEVVAHLWDDWIATAAAECSRHLRLPLGFRISKTERGLISIAMVIREAGPVVG